MWGYLVKMKCENHKSKNSIGTCVGCGGPFCEECMLKVGRKNFCKDCASEQLKEHHSNNKNNTDHPSVIVTQQTTNNNSNAGSDKVRGSGVWLCFWIIVCWPVAIIYYFMRRW